jgi:hypothetical protein
MRSKLISFWAVRYLRGQLPFHFYTKMATQLDQLKAATVVVADTGDFNSAPSCAVALYFEPAIPYC